MSSSLNLITRDKNLIDYIYNSSIYDNTKLMNSYVAWKACVTILATWPSIHRNVNSLYENDGVFRSSFNFLPSRVTFMNP